MVGTPVPRNLPDEEDVSIHSYERVASMLRGLRSALRLDAWWLHQHPVSQVNGRATNGGPNGSRSDTTETAFRRVVKANLRAANRYLLRPYPGRIVLIRWEERARFDPVWRAIALGGIEIHEIGDPHQAYAPDSETPGLVETMTRCIEEAQEAANAVLLV